MFMPINGNCSAFSSLCFHKGTFTLLYHLFLALWNTYISCHFRVSMITLLHTHPYRTMASKRASLIRSASNGNLQEFEELLLPTPSNSLQEAALTLEQLAGIAAEHHHARILEFCISIGANVNDKAIRMGLLKSGHLNVHKAVIAAGSTSITTTTESQEARSCGRR